MTQLTLFSNNEPPVTLQPVPENNEPTSTLEEKYFRCITWQDCVKFVLNQVALSCWQVIEISGMMQDGSRYVRLS